MTLAAQLLSARVPRYTSYPTAPHFHCGVTAKDYAKWLRAIPDRADLSLYLHIPFCDSLCWFCGCHTKIVNSYEPVSEYVELLLAEIDMIAGRFGQRMPVSHIHWGGGSPTILSRADIERLSAKLRQKFDVGSAAEFAVEVDPRGLTTDTVNALKDVGVTRVSIGVQDCSQKVQQAINRIQPFAVTERACVLFRAAGITAINIDLVYGLPHQTAESLEETIKFVATLSPQRLAVFGYAHVPHFKKHQSLIPETALPSPEQRLEQFQLTQRLLTESGYVAIGLDHFARCDDPLAIVQARGALRRNFQGYTSDAASALIGMGLSSISAGPDGYAQNYTDFRDYRNAIRSGTLPVSRGVALSDDDRIRASVIEKLMCDLTADLGKIASEFGVAPDYFAGELEDLRAFVDEGLLVIEDNRISVLPGWRMAVRLVCAAFDTYLASSFRYAAAV